MAIFVVTGGAGFIGSHLVDALLAEGHDVRVIDDLSTGKTENVDSRAHLIQADICDTATLQAALQDAAGCFHLAAIASVQRANEDWAGTHRVNLTGSICVFDACRAAKIPVVYASSAAVYGNVGDQVAHENLPCVPQTAYGADKYGSELHAAVGWGVHGVPSFGMRFFNVYGPRQDPASPYSGVISIFADRVARTLPVTVHGDGGQTRDFVFVADVVAHLRAAMRKVAADPGAYVSNVCTGVETSVLQLAQTLGASEILHGDTRSGDIRRSVGSAETATALLQIRATTPLADGLKTLFADRRGRPVPGCYQGGAKLSDGWHVAPECAKQRLQSARNSRLGMSKSVLAAKLYRKPMVLAALYLLASGTSHADDADSARQFNADTPGKGYAPYTVAQGYFQMESDIFHITEQGRMQTIEFFDPVFKYGLADTVDIEVQTNGFYEMSDRENGRNVHTFGYGDIVPAVKWGFFGDDSQALSAALRFGVKIPTASAKIGNGAVEYYAVLPTQMTLPYGLTLQIQEEIDLLKNQADTGKNFNYAEDVSLSRNYGRLTYSLEMFAQSDTDPNAHALYTADIGLSYIATPVVVVTAGLYVGLNRYAPDVEVFTGFGFRF